MNDISAPLYTSVGLVYLNEVLSCRWWDFFKLQVLLVLLLYILHVHHCNLVRQADLFVPH